MAAARTIKVLVLNLCVEREPLYGIGEWACRFEAGALSLEPGEVALLCDDRVGRALDRLFDADRASLLTELTLVAIREFGTCRPMGASGAASQRPPRSAVTTRSIAAI